MVSIPPGAAPGLLELLGETYEAIARYLAHWWRGDLREHYVLWGYTIVEVHRCFQIAQYCTGLLSFFDLVRITDVSGKMRSLSAVPAYGFRFFSVILNSPNLLMRLGAGAYISARYRQPLDTTLREALLEHIWVAKTEAEKAAEEMDRKMAGSTAERFLFWLESHVLTERLVRILTFCAFAVFSLGEMLTDPL